MSVAYYNENDPYAAQWLRNLIAAGHIAPGDVDERSIVDVRGTDLAGYGQCHFFAGIGGWSLALRLAGWPDDRPVWTGSCPCQPFSAAGAGKAADDSRHLWPAWLPLITECRPAIIFGEQVEAAIGWGWLDAVFADLEEQGYACGATVLPACGVGAFHIRQRLWFVANATSRGRDEPARLIQASEERPTDPRPDNDREYAQGPCGRGRTGILADAAGGRLREQRDASRPGSGGHADGGVIAGGMEHADSDQSGLEGRQRELRERARQRSPWAASTFIECTDGKSRPVEPGSFPLAHGVQRRTSKLRAYGNAIVPQVAAEFIAAAVEAIECHPYGKIVMSEPKQWIVHGRFTFDGHALVEAETIEEARAKFDAGEFEFDIATASCSDWERRNITED